MTLTRRNLKIYISIVLSLILVFLIVIYIIPTIKENYARSLPQLQVNLKLNIPSYLEDLAKNKDETFNLIINEIRSDINRNSEQNIFSLLTTKCLEKQLLLINYYGNFDNSNEKIILALQSKTAETFDRCIQVLQNRLDRYGIIGAFIKKKNQSNLTIYLPITSSLNENLENAKSLSFKRAKLEFKLVKDASFAIPIMNSIDIVLSGGYKNSNANEIKNMTEDEFAKLHPFFAIARLIDPQGRIADAYMKESNKEKFIEFMKTPEVKKVIPTNVEFLFDAKSVKDSDGMNYCRMYMVDKEASLNGDVIVDAESQIEPETSSPIITIEMNSDGTRDWAQITSSNINKRCAIVLDGVVYSAPNIIREISSGRSQISGLSNLDEAKWLEIVLKAGALPASFDFVSSQVVNSNK